MTTAVTISERAARRIGEILEGEGDGAMLRISVEGGGCSGFGSAAPQTAGRGWNRGRSHKARGGQPFRPTRFFSPYPFDSARLRT